MGDDYYHLSSVVVLLQLAVCLVVHDVVVRDEDAGERLGAVKEYGLAAARNARAVEDVLVDRHVGTAAIQEYRRLLLAMGGCDRSAGRQVRVGR